jgi:predicted nuclease with TOPRIM domain
VDRAGPTDDTALVAQTFRAAADAAQSPSDARPDKKADDEKMSLFWRVFGGTILSICALVAITLFNNLSSTLTELRAEINKANEARALADATMVRKEEFQSRMTSSWDRVQSLQQHNTAQAATLTSLRTEIDGLKERLTKQTSDADAVRKDSAAAADALKKDVAALELVKERLAAVALEMKSSRDDFSKLRADVDKNQAYDFERRDRRDGQYKQIDETLKELQKGLQDCREKLARLEGQYGPPAPKKNNRPAAKDGTEKAPTPAKSAPPIPPSKGDG